MMMPSKLSFAILFVMVGLLCNCATLKAPDPEVCLSLGLGGGFCRTPLSLRERTIPEPYWSTCEPKDEAEPNKPCKPMLLHIHPFHIGEMLSFVEKVCDKYQNCVAEDIEKGKIFLQEMKGLINYEFHP